MVETVVVSTGPEPGYPTTLPVLTIPPVDSHGALLHEYDVTTRLQRSKKTTFKKEGKAMSNTRLTCVPQLMSPRPSPR